MKSFLPKLAYIVLLIILGGASIALGLSLALLQSKLQNVDTILLESSYISKGNNVEERVSALVSTLEQIEQSKKNSDLKTYGVVKGEILPFVTETAGLSRYQMVCAEKVDNIDITSCVTVPTSTRDYSLTLPSGEYYVYAMLKGDNVSDALKNFKAYYTVEIECTQKATECIPDGSDKKALVTVSPGETTNEINPTAWEL